MKVFWVTFVLLMGAAWSVGTTKGPDKEETECEASEKKVLLPTLLLMLLPTFINVCACVALVFIVLRVRKLKSENDEIFQKSLELIRITLRATIPKRSQDQIIKAVVGAAPPDEESVPSDKEKED